MLIQLKQTVRLGEGEFDDQVLQPEAIDRAVSVSQQFASMIRSYGADDIIAVATAATREAKNQREFVQRLQDAAQLDGRVVSGQEEARLIYLGVSSGFHLKNRQAFFIDIGGGSTEVILGTQHQYRYLNSLRLGAIRLSGQFPAGPHGVVSPGKYNRILHYVQRHAVHTLREMRAHDIDLAIGSSGTIENLADIAARRFAKHRLQRDGVLTAPHLREVVKLLGAMPLKERRRVPGLNPERADIVMAGAAILEGFMQALEISAIRISDRGLREGLLMDYLLRHGHAPALQDLSVRQRSVPRPGPHLPFRRDARSHHGALGPGAVRQRRRRQPAPIRGVGARVAGARRPAAPHRRVPDLQQLSGAHLLPHPQCQPARLRRDGNRHHRPPRRCSTARPSRSASAREFAALDRQAQKIVRVLSLLLRFAESLDRSHAGNVRHARFRLKENSHAVLDIHALQDCQIELWAVQKHVAAFERVFGYKLDMEVVMQREASAARTTQRP